MTEDATVTTVQFSDTAAAGQAKNPACAAFACAVLEFQVFPLLSGTKRPAIAGWQEAATASLEEVQYWFTGEFQDASVGIATGPGSNLFVLDIDVKNGVDGFASLAQLCNAYTGDARPLPKTLTVATPSGGAHLYFRWAEGVVNSSNEIGPGLDVRGFGGLVHAPGWGGYAVVPRNGVRSVNVADAPAWLVELCRKQPRGETLAALDEESKGSVGRVVGTHRALLALSEAPHGARNVELNRCAFRLGLRGEMTRDAAWRSCYGILVDMGAGDGEADWLRTFNSGWNNGVAKRGTDT